MAEYLKFLVLFVLGSIGGFINVSGGGGSSLFLPFLILLGVEGAVANGTNRIAIFSQNLFAVTSFRKRQVHHFKKSFQLTLFMLPGALIGAILAVVISHAVFQRILGIVMIGIVLSILFIGRNQNQSNPAKKEKHWLAYTLLFLTGFYGGFIQTGAGLIIIAVLYHTLKLDMLQVNMHKVFIIMLYTIPVMGIFISKGKINWGYGLSLSAGMALGGWWGAHHAVKKGEKAMRIILALGIFIIAFRLLDFF